MEINLPIKLLDSSIPLPEFAHAGDAAFDLRSTISTELIPFQPKIIPCGFSLELPEGFAGLVLPRSGLASNQSVTVVNAPGLIDSGYRGEICAAMINLKSDSVFSISKGDRIAQLLIIEIPKVNLSSVDQLQSSARGKCGFGSSGIK